MAVAAWGCMACYTLAVATCGPAWWQLLFVAAAAVFLYAAPDPPTDRRDDQ